MKVQSQIEDKIKQALRPSHLEVINESSMHSVPLARSEPLQRGEGPPGSESHFKVIVVSGEFAGKKTLDRQRLMNTLLAQELKESIHALSLQTFTPEEWQARGGKVTPSPECLGGEKKG
jgi:stress-induced morphogen